MPTSPAAKRRTLACRGALLAMVLAPGGACSWKKFEQLEGHANEPDGAASDGGDQRDASAEADAGHADADAGRGELDAGPRPDAGSPEPRDAQAPLDGGPDNAPPPPQFDDAGCPVGSDGRPVGLPLIGAGPFVELARVTDPALISRVIGPSASIGGRRVWLLNFHWGPIFPNTPAGTPLNYPTAALQTADEPWARAAMVPAAPWQLEASLTSDGLPLPFVPLSGEESLATVLTPYSLVTDDGDANALAFVRKDILGDDAASEVVLADLAANSVTTVRREGWLFHRPDPLFLHGAYRDQANVTLFGCDYELRDSLRHGFCVVARAPRDRVAERPAYQVLTRRADGAFEWTTNLNAGARMIEDVGGSLSVSFNAYLQKFLAVHSTSFGNAIILQTADAVEGPWVKVAEVPLPAPPVMWPTFDAREHPSIVRRCGAQLVVTYFEPLTLSADGFPATGEAVLGTIDLTSR